MKKLTQFLMLLAVAGFVYACGGASAAKTPEDAVKNFFTALGKNDYDGAKKFATAKTQEVLDQVKAANQGKEGGGFDVKEVTCTGEGDAKMCNLCCDSKGNPKNDVEVVKEGEEWKVKMESKDQFKKEEGAAGGLGGMLEDAANSAIEEVGGAMENVANEINENLNSEESHDNGGH